MVGKPTAKQMNLSKVKGGPKTTHKPSPTISETDLERLVDMYLIKPGTTPEEVATMKEGKPYQWMRQAFSDGFRMAEKGVRPKPIIQVA
jgi:hypothetical protein